MATVEEGNML